MHRAPAGGQPERPLLGLARADRGLQGLERAPLEHRGDELDLPRRRLELKLLSVHQDRLPGEADEALGVEVLALEAGALELPAPDIVDALVREMPSRTHALGEE